MTFPRTATAVARAVLTLATRRSCSIWWMACCNRWTVSQIQSLTIGVCSKRQRKHDPRSSAADTPPADLARGWTWPAGDAATTIFAPIFAVRSASAASGVSNTGSALMPCASRTEPIELCRKLENDPNGVRSNRRKHLSAKAFRLTRKSRGTKIGTTPSD